MMFEESWTLSFDLSHHKLFKVRSQETKKTDLDIQKGHKNKCFSDISKRGTCTQGITDVTSKSWL